MRQFCFFTMVSIMILSIIGCSSFEEIQNSSLLVEEEYTESSDTIFMLADTPTLKSIEIDCTSNKFKDLLESIEPSITRSEESIDVFLLYDDMTEKSAYVIQNPKNSSEWIYECNSSNGENSVIIFFEQIEEDLFVAKDENGGILRYFSYDSANRELWSSNTTTKAMSRRDSILCGSAFTALGWLIGEALALPTGGTSLAIGIGFTVASAYICN